MSKTKENERSQRQYETMRLGGAKHFRICEDMKQTRKRSSKQCHYFVPGLYIVNKCSAMHVCTVHSFKDTSTLLSDQSRYETCTNDCGN